MKKTKNNLRAYQDILEEKKITIEYQIMDADRLMLPSGEFDCVIANHMLYHVKEREFCLQKIAKALKSGGRLCCATIGNGHLQEMHEMVAGFDARIDMPSRNITEGFRLENGREQLEKVFTKVERTDYRNDLLVDDAAAIYNYVKSYPGNAAYVLEERGEELMELLQNRIKEEGVIYIKGRTGIFVCMKN